MPIPHPGRGTSAQVPLHSVRRPRTAAGSLQFRELTDLGLILLRRLYNGFGQNALSSRSPPRAAVNRGEDHISSLSALSPYIYYRK